MGVPRTGWYWWLTFSIPQEHQLLTLSYWFWTLFLYSSPFLVHLKRIFLFSYSNWHWLSKLLHFSCRLTLFFLLKVHVWVLDYILIEHFPTHYYSLITFFKINTKSFTYFTLRYDQTKTHSTQITTSRLLFPTPILPRHYQPKPILQQTTGKALPLLKPFHNSSLPLLPQLYLQYSSSLSLDKNHFFSCRLLGFSLITSLYPSLVIL